MMPLPPVPSASAPEAPPATASAPNAAAPLRWRSQELLQGQREVQIEHQGLVYRLQVTSLGKLILTK